MMEVFATLLITLVLAVPLWRLLRSSKPTPGNSGELRDRGLNNCPPQHCQYFSQVRQALSISDEQYLRERASPLVARKALQERRNVAKKFLAGLYQDFSNLERWGRTIAALSPAIARRQETERLALGFKFRVLYAWVWLRLSTGNVSLPAMESLTGLVGRYAAHMQQAMEAINIMSAGGLRTKINA